MESRGGRTVQSPRTMTIPLPGGEIVVQPSEVLTDSAGITCVRRVKTGKARSEEIEDVEYAMFALATTATHGSDSRLEAVHLTCETVQPVVLSMKKLEAQRLKAQSALADVRAARFPARPDRRPCPRCPSYFLCGDLPPGRLSRKILVDEFPVSGASRD